MSAYTDRPADWCARIDGATYAVRGAPLVWHVGREGRGEPIVIPPDFTFDLSVPWWLRWAASPHDTRYLGAACLHDWCLLDNWQVGQAAGVFNDALVADGVGRLRAGVMALAVMLFATRPITDIEEASRAHD